MRILLPIILLFGCKDKAETIDSGTSEFDLDAISSTERPSQRSEVYGIGDPGSNSILVFGGNEGPVVNQQPTSVFLEETWIFEPGAGWAELDIDMPSARARYGAAYDPAGERALIFGGRYREAGGSGNYDLFSELWEFDYPSQEWTLLDDGSGPDARTYPSLAWDDTEQALYLFGGMTNASPMSIIVDEEIWRYKDGEWEELTATGDAPSTRTFLGEAWDSERRRLVLFSGQVGDYWSGSYDETYALDIETLEWTELNDGDDAPSTRMHPHAVYDAERDRYLLFGGHTDIGDANDIWAMDPDSGEWSSVREADTFTGEGLGCNGNSSDVPADYVEQDLSAPERRHRGIFTLMHDSLWIFGGMHAECSDHLDDTWRYPLEEGDWTELIEARSGESCARQDADCECLCY
jgi:hypothetical protein